MFSLLEHFLTFKPNSSNHGALDQLPHERLRIGSEFGLDLDAAWFPRGSSSAVLFLHGNRHNITRFYEHYALFERLGISCLTFDYPGYGTSAGRPSEAALYASARAAYTHLVHSLGFNQKQIGIYGCSLGGAVAVELASTVTAGCLIAESTFTNSHEIASFLYPYLPVTRFLPRRFTNDSRVGTIDIPKLIIHGDQDQRVPVQMAYTLHSRAVDPKQLVIIPDADHINCIQKGGHKLWYQIGDFIAAHCASA
jgi:pimeloyl-ACP methyl ester carboxylesterase